MNNEFISRKDEQRLQGEINYNYTRPDAPIMEVKMTREKEVVMDSSIFLP